ncbi:MAG TPA: glycoside hydrolase N-terminal domain-containing protein [Rugosimonospora sp.]
MDHRDSDDLILAWRRPAERWDEAVPVGNGRLAAMVFGGTDRARFQINDATVWSGTPETPALGLAAVRAAGAGPDRLAEIRTAIRAEDYRRAEDLLMSFEGDYSQSYLPYADLVMSLSGGEGRYRRRTLNLGTGVVTELFETGGRTVTRYTWASRPAGALCVAVEVSGGALDMALDLSSPLRAVHAAVAGTGPVLGVEIPVDGAPPHEPSVAEPLRYGPGPDGYDPFGAIAVTVHTDGSVGTDGDVGSVGADGSVGTANGSWSVRGMSRALVVVASSTSAEDAWAGNSDRAAPGRAARSASRTDHLDRAARRSATAAALGAPALRAEHERGMRDLLGGAGLTIGTRRAGTVDVDEVLSGTDEHLTATVVVALGRYLLASASRPGGGPPANLQGLWNAELRPPWSSNYTININTQMNYWGAEAAGLSACHEPLFDLIERLAATGGQVARELYGARGWVAHHNTDMWGWALPVGMGHSNPSWAIWMMGGVWLSQHLWDRYDFTRDTDFLRERAWPLLRGSALFCLDWLVDGPDGRLDTIPATSPENLFISGAGTVESLSYSTTMDVTLIRALFTRCLAAAGVLGLTEPVCDEIRSALPRLRPPTIAADGRLREWVVDHVEQDPHHRHTSHLIGLHPLDQIDPETTPDLAAAATKVLDGRGPGGMGWSWAWKIALRARLGDAASARCLLLEATRRFDRDPDEFAPVDGSRSGGLLPNLFSTHPPFQMDGNFGLMAAVLEMVVDSHGDVIRLLPAVPRQWPTGTAFGIACRGGWLVDVDWRDGELAAVSVRACSPDRPGTARLSCRGRTTRVAVGAGERVRLGPALDEVTREEIR